MLNEVSKHQRQSYAVSTLEKGSSVKSTSFTFCCIYDALWNNMAQNLWINLLRPVNAFFFSTRVHGGFLIIVTSSETKCFGRRIGRLSLSVGILTSTWKQNEHTAQTTWIISIVALVSVRASKGK